MWCSTWALVLFILVQPYDDEEEKDDNHGISHLLKKKVTTLMTPESAVHSTGSVGDPCSFALIWGSMVDLNGVKTNCGIAHILGILLMNGTYDI